ncbi:uncharacterized protein LOC109714398 isoform X2 [Ananas comosus]|uniref:Uncharacterized protein LOC109714398 isoform X2 n=1 Tax=Ananas comosus TaxID=4615 RepID=A0A6P5FGA0_ANACO|nr:uncharacterized protein LOC109714398 isoform X2 [Ananas comosus]
MQEWIRRKCEFESLLLGFEFSLIVVKVSHLVSRKGEILLRPASLRKENGYIVLVKIYQLELRKLKWEARHAVFVIFLLHFEQVFFVRTYV